MPLGLKININDEEKDLDDIFLKIADYNTNQSNYQTEEVVQLTLETGIKYIDENGVKKDIIYRYIGYDSDGYTAANYKANTNRIDASQMANITDKNENNLVDLFYQLGTKKKGNTYNISMANTYKQVDFQMTFVQKAEITVEASYNKNLIKMIYNKISIITIDQTEVIYDLPSEAIIKIQHPVITTPIHSRIKMFLNGLIKINVGPGDYNILYYIYGTP